MKGYENFCKWLEVLGFVKQDNPFILSWGNPQPHVWKHSIGGLLILTREDNDKIKIAIGNGYEASYTYKEAEHMILSISYVKLHKLRVNYGSKVEEINSWFDEHFADLTK